jgi:hypothetical protein
VLAVALAEAVLQQCRTTALVPMQSFDTDERQVPMGLGRPIMFRLLEDGSDFGLLLPDYTSCNNRREQNSVWEIAAYCRWTWCRMR